MIELKKLKDRETNDYIKNNEEYSYWTDGQKVYFEKHNIPLQNAKAKKFEYYKNLFAKDDKRCYCGRELLRGANAKSFVVLNECFAKDDRFIFASSGEYTKGAAKKLENTDSIEVCDSGIWGDIFHAGYIKSESEVFYYHALYESIITVKEGDSKTFISMNDGAYAKDKNYAYAFGKSLKKNTCVEIREYMGMEYVNVYGKIIDIENMYIPIPKVCIKLEESEYTKEFKIENKTGGSVWVEFNKVSKECRLE